MNVGRISLGECDGRLYAVFSSFNDPAYGTTDDCCASAGQVYGANGEVYLTISNDLSGYFWDAPRNLSNSYTPLCDTGSCADDRFASVARMESDDAQFPGSETWPVAATYDPSGSYTGTKFLHVFYEADRYPGTPIFGASSGPYTLNEMLWIRLACVPPVPEASLQLQPAFICAPNTRSRAFRKMYL